MNKSATASGVVLGKGITMVLLGGVHEAAIPLELEKVRPHIPPAFATDYAIYFGLAGLLFLLCGLVDVLSSFAIGRADRLARRLVYSTSVISMMMGGVGAFVFWKGPPFLILFLGIVGLITLLACRSAQQPTKGRP